MRAYISGGRRALGPALTILLLAGLLALVLAGCGGSASGPSSPHPTAALTPEPAKQGVWDFVSRPDLNAATLRVETATGDAAPGLVFVTPGNAAFGETGPLIVDAKGDPVWVGTVPTGENATDFRVQTYLGRPMLTWWQDKIVKPGYGAGAGVIADGSYRIVARVRAGGGLKADVHEFTVTPQGTALITAYRVVPHDLSAVGGSKQGKVLDSLVQVIDIRSGRMLFQWDPLEQVPLTDSYMNASRGKLFDPYHVNSAAIDSDGHLVVSARHTWAVYAVDMQTGGIVWRMGGKHSDLELGPGVSFAWQHAAVPFGSGGAMVLFDNEASGSKKALVKEAPESYALVLRVDEVARTVTLLHKFSHPGALAPSQGNVQALPGGHFFVGWGSVPYASEYAPDGTLVWDARFYETNQSYRAFKSVWTGRPLRAPALVARAAGARVELSMSWNGATEVTGWRVLAGPRQDALKVVGTTRRKGFETTVTVEPARFYQVRALVDGRVLSASAVVRVTAPTPSPSAAPDSPAASPGTPGPSPSP